MTRPASLLAKGIVPISLALVLPLAAAAPQLTFRNVHYSPKPARAGDMLKISFDVHVSGGPMTPTAVVEEVPRRPGPPPPVIVLARLDPGDHMIDVFTYVVPANPPARVCFRIALPGGELRDACLKRIRGSDGRWWMDVDTPGHWTAIPTTPTAAGPAPAGKPDLKLSGSVWVDAMVLRNDGMAPASNISVRKACFYKQTWMPVGGDREVRVLGLGEEVPLKLGKLGNGLGTCPPGTTRVRVTADPADRIEELDENNNTLEGDALADLRVSDFRIYYPTTGPHAWSGHRVYFKVTNAGFDAGRFAWEVSTQSGGGGDWRSVFGTTIPGLAAGQTLEVDVPAARPFASLQRAAVLLSVDALRQIDESNEGNNRSMLAHVAEIPRR